MFWHLARGGYPRWYHQFYRPVVHGHQLADVSVVLCSGNHYRPVGPSVFSNFHANTYPAVPVFVASKRLAWLVQTALLLSVVGMALWLFIPVGMHQHVNNGSFLVESGLGVSGWGSGAAWILGISNGMYAFGGTDGGKLRAS